MKTAKRSVGVFILGIATLQAGVWAPRSDAAENFEYPELTVTPRASDRLEMEAKQEWDRRGTMFLPLQVSAAATLLAGFVQNSNTDPSKDSQGHSPIAGYVVGGGWLVLSTAMMFASQPYDAAWREIAPMPRRTVREQLTRERMAEELIQRQARTGRTVRWLSFASNAFASIYMLSNGNDTAKAFDTIALVGALAPLIFPFHWEDVARDQADYKKRIYAPVASATVFKTPGQNSYAPGMNLSFQF